MLTHKNVTTTQIYADLVNSKKRETTNKISKKQGENAINTICIIQQ
jgi:site-specific recombinase XerD